jgi:GNAT superfamily N-acetyltransferase
VPDFSSLRIDPLQSSHDRTGFSCGQPQLDRYFHQQINQDAKRRLAAPFVATDEAGKVVGFYTLAAESIRLAALPAEITRRLPHYPAVPAVLLGRLAVDRTMQGQGLGRYLLADALLRAVRSEIMAYGFVVDPIDQASRRFYEREGFLPLLDAGGRLYRRLAEIAVAFG